MVSDHWRRSFELNVHFDRYTRKRKQNMRLGGKSERLSLQISNSSSMTATIDWRWHILIITSKKKKQQPKIIHGVTQIKMTVILRDCIFYRIISTTHAVNCSNWNIMPWHRKLTTETFNIGFYSNIKTHSSLILFACFFGVSVFILVKWFFIQIFWKNRPNISKNKIEKRPNCKNFILRNQFKAAAILVHSSDLWGRDIYNRLSNNLTAMEKL